MKRRFSFVIVCLLTLIASTVGFAVDQDYFIGEWAGDTGYTRVFAMGIEIDPEYVPKEIKGPFPMEILISNNGGLAAKFNNAFDASEVTISGSSITMVFPNSGIDSEGYPIKTVLSGTLSDDYNNISGVVDVYRTADNSLVLQGYFNVDAVAMGDQTLENNETETPLPETGEDDTEEASPGEVDEATEAPPEDHAEAQTDGQGDGEFESVTSDEENEKTQAETEKPSNETSETTDQPAAANPPIKDEKTALNYVKDFNEGTKDFGKFLGGMYDYYSKMEGFYFETSEGKKLIKNLEILAEKDDELKFILRYNRGTKVVLENTGKLFGYLGMAADANDNIKNGDGIIYGTTKSVAVNYTAMAIMENNPIIAASEFAQWMALGGTKAESIVSPETTMKGSMNIILDTTLGGYNDKAITDKAKKGQYGGLVQSINDTMAFVAEEAYSEEKSAGAILKELATEEDGKLPFFDKMQKDTDKLFGIEKEPEGALAKTGYYVRSGLASVPKFFIKATEGFAWMAVEFGLSGK